MSLIRFREKLAAAPVTYGTWLTIASSQSAEMMGRTGFDWVVIDTQHGGFSEALLLPALQALELTGMPALVRVPWNDPALLMRSLDLGAAGVIVPMVNSVSDAQAAVSAARYPPDGIRSFGPVRSTYAVDGAAVRPLCIAMIETVAALEDLDAIAAVPGLDGLLVGPVDLALAMGHGLSLEMPDAVFEAVGRVADACRARGILAGSVAFGHDSAARQVARGVNFITSGADSFFMQRAAVQEIEALRKIEPPAA